MWWVCHLAASCMHHGARHRFDRPDRREKGIFRLGRLWLLHILHRAPSTGAVCSCLPFTKKENGWTFSLRFSKVSGREVDGRGHHPCGRFVFLHV